MTDNDIKDICLDWAVELQFIAQAGLAYSKDPFDLERFERIREIAAEMMSAKSGLTMDKVKELFCNESGFQTPKMDTRGVVIEDNKILLVKETDGLWAIPGGWVDVNQSIKSNVEKEVKEEAGLDVVAERIVALHDRKKHNLPPRAYGICKIFILCRRLGGEFVSNTETVDSGFFALDELPDSLAVAKSNLEQIKLCFDASKDENWQPVFD